MGRYFCTASAAATAEFTPPLLRMIAKSLAIVSPGGKCNRGGTETRRQTRRREENPSAGEDYTLDTILEDRDVEVDQQGDAVAGGAKVTDALGPVHIIEALAGLELDDEPPFDQEIQ